MISGGTHRRKNPLSKFKSEYRIANKEFRIMKCLFFHFDIHYSLFDILRFYFFSPVKTFIISCLVAAGFRERISATRFATKAAEMDVPA